MKDQILELSIHKIDPNLRMAFDAQDIENLCDSIHSNGQQEPVRVWFDGERFRILDGEMRWRACARLGMTHIKALMEQTPFLP